MSVISTFKAAVRQTFQQSNNAIPDPNDISPAHGDVHIYRLVDIQRAAKTIVDHANRRHWDDRFTGRVVLMVYGNLDYRQWYELTRAIVLRCPASLALTAPTYGRLQANGHQQFVFEKCDTSSRRE